MSVIGVGQITLFDQNDSPVATLSNEAHPVPSNSDGSSPNLTGASSIFSIMLAGVDITNLYSVTASPSSGVTGSLSTYTYTVSGMTVDAGYVDFTAIRPGFATLTKRFSLSKMKAGPGTWTPIATGTAVKVSDSHFRKPYGGTSRDGQVYSAEGYSSCYCSAKTESLTGSIMFGLNADPATDDQFQSIDFAWYFRSIDGLIHIYESGVDIGSYGAFTTSTILLMTYDGANVRYFADGMLQRTVAASGMMYFDSSFYESGATVGIKDVRFGPMGEVGPKGDTGIDGPRYIGMAFDTVVAAERNNDTYLRFSETPGDSNRGIFAWDGAQFNRTDEFEFVGKALADIANITRILADGEDGRRAVIDWAASTAFALNEIVEGGDGFYKVITAGTSGSTQPTWAGADITDGGITWAYLGARPYLYGKPEDYGVDEGRATILRTAYVHELRGKDAWFEGNINAIDGNFGGNLTSPSLKTDKAQLGATISAPSFGYIKGDNVIAAFNAFASGKYTATGTMNSKTNSFLFKITAESYNYIYQDDNTQYSVTPESWTQYSSLTSIVDGECKIWFAASGIYCTTHVQIRVNGTAVYTFETASDDYDYRGVVRELKVGDVVTMWAYREKTNAIFQYAKVDHFRICPTVGTIGIQNSTDGKVKVYDAGKYYSYQTGAVTASGTTYTVANTHWSGASFIDDFDALVPHGITQLVDQSQSFDGKAVYSILYIPRTSLKITYTGSQGSVTILWNSYYSYNSSTSKIKLLTASGVIKFFDNFKFTKETIGTTDHLVLRDGSNFMMSFNPSWFLDYMVSSAYIFGTGSTGSYVKFNNGLLLQWKEETVNLDLNTAYAEGFYASRDWVPPVDWYDDQVFIYAAAKPASRLAMGCYNDSVRDNDSATYSFVDLSSSATAVSTHIVWFAIGRWK